MWNSVKTLKWCQSERWEEFPPFFKCFQAEADRRIGRQCGVKVCAIIHPCTHICSIWAEVRKLKGVCCIYLKTFRSEAIAHPRLLSQRRLWARGVTALMCQNKRQTVFCCRLTLWERQRHPGREVGEGIHRRVLMALVIFYLLSVEKKVL